MSKCDLTSPMFESCIEITNGTGGLLLRFTLIRDWIMQRNGHFRLVELISHLHSDLVCGRLKQILMSVKLKYVLPGRVLNS